MKKNCLAVWNKQIRAFTLSEVLITLVIIGIIAAITLTTVMPNIQERVNSQRQANIVYKVTQATNLMKANGAMINGFESTDAFVDELQKYLKIMKRCDSEHIADCWPTKKVRTSEGKEFEVLNAKTRENLNFKDDYKDNNNVGIVLTDGASIIMTYDPTNTGLSIGDELISINKALPVGNGYKDYLEYTTNTTSGLAFVMDVNGGKGPNSETMQGKMYDIRSFNLAQFSKGCSGSKIDGKCFVYPDSITSIDCSRTNGVLNSPANNQYCGSNSSLADDYWAGAQKICADKGMRVPDKTTLQSICLSYKNKLNISSDGGPFWSSDLNDTGGRGYNLMWGNKSCSIQDNWRGLSNGRVLCIED